MMSEGSNITEKQIVAGDPTVFAIGYAFVDRSKTTEISMFINGDNILGFTKQGNQYTTRWAYLDGIVGWLNEFALTMHADPYPVSAEGDFAAQKDCNARTFFSEDFDEMDAYYTLLNDWTYEHTWLSERAGAILANVFFEYKDGIVELSWNNLEDHDGASFDCKFGSARVDAKVFKSVVRTFVDAYEKHWGITLDR